MLNTVMYFERVLYELDSVKHYVLLNAVTKIYKNLINSLIFVASLGERHV